MVNRWEDCVWAFSILWKQWDLYLCMGCGILGGVGQRGPGSGRVVLCMCEL